MRAVIARLVAGGGALVLGACGGSTGAGGAADRSARPSATAVRIVASSTTLATTGPASSTPQGSSTTTASRTSSGAAVSIVSGAGTSGRRATADVVVDGASISVRDDGAGALVVTTLETSPGWIATVDEHDPAALVVELTTSGRRTLVEIRLTADGIVTSSDTRTVAP